MSDAEQLDRLALEALHVATAPALARAIELEAQACQKWGMQAQAFMVCEEAGELTTAICQFGRDRITAAELIDEAADGVIVSAAAAFLAKGTLADLEAAIHRKLDRLEARINGAHGHFGAPATLQPSGATA